MTDPPANPLVTALANGQPQAFADLYDRLGPALWRVARSMLGSSSQVEDAVQDVFVELVRRRDRLGHIRDLDAYLFTIMRHNVLGQIEREKTERKYRQQMAINTIAGPEHAVNDDLALAMQSLPAQQREVIVLKIEGGLTFAQIALVLDVSPNTAASRYRYAIEKLRTALEVNR